MLSVVYDSRAETKTECKFDREELELFCEALEKNRKLNGLYMRSKYSYNKRVIEWLFHEQLMFMINRLWNRKY